MIVLFLPSLIMFPINDPNVIGRKEFLFFFGLLINLFLVEKTFRPLEENFILKKSLRNQKQKNDINRYSFSLFILYNLLSIPTALSHEAIIFLAIPLNMVITSNFIGLVYSKNQAFLRTLLIYLPTIFVSFLCLIFNGNREIALGICQSWQEYSHIHSILFANCSNQLPGMLEFYATSAMDAVKIIFEKNIYPSNQSISLVFFFWIFTFSLNTIILMRASSSILTKSLDDLIYKIAERNKSDAISSINPLALVTSFSFKYAFIPFICSFILYIIAADWGRWFFITSITYTLCLLSTSLIRIEIASYHKDGWLLEFFSPIYSIYSKFINYLYNHSLSKKFSAIYFVALIYTFFMLRIPHYNITINDLYNQTSLYKLVSNSSCQNSNSNRNILHTGTVIHPPNGVLQDGYLAHAPMKIEFKLTDTIRELSVCFGIVDGAWQKGETDGVEFRIIARVLNDREKVIFSRRLEPASKPQDRGIQQATIDLSIIDAHEVILETLPGETTPWDWSYWSELTIK